MDGMLDIKLKLRGLDHWETVYAALEGETLNLFKDRNAAVERTSRWPPISVSTAVCKENPYYRRKDHTFKLILEDGSQYLFAAESREVQLRWVERLQSSTSPVNSSEDSGGRSRFSLSVQTEGGAAGEQKTSVRPGGRGGHDREASLEREPPPKPPHTYYNMHHYPEGGETAGQGNMLRSSRNLERSQPPSTPPPLPPQVLEETGFKPKTSVFKKLFRK